MPVDFRVKSAKIAPQGALLLVIDRSGSMSGDKLQLSKAAAVAAVDVLGPRDFVGVVAFDDRPDWVVPVSPVGDGEAIRRRIAGLASMGGTDLYPAMVEGYEALQRTRAAVKHMVILTDGQTPMNQHRELSAAMHQQGITTTAIAVGQDADRSLLTGIARTGGGKFYQVHDPRAIPRIFMKEALRVARPLVYEDPGGIELQRKADHEILQGIDGPLPAVTGFVLTTPKTNPLVEIPLRATRPNVGENAILASWQYGLGRSVAWTTDAGQRWAHDWTTWSGYDKLFVQMIRWAMRPTDGSGQFNLVAEGEDGRVRVVVNALDKDESFLNLLTITGTAIGPDLEPIALEFRQSAPGRYVGDFAADRPGSYFLSVQPGAGHAPLRTGIAIASSAEFNATATNLPLLEQLASLQPNSGPPGRVLSLPESSTPTAAPQANVFRDDLPKPRSRQPIWPLVVFVASCLFFVDVLNRRILISFAWMPPLLQSVMNKLRRQTPAAEPEVALSRLKARKSEVQRTLASQAASARFETPSDTAATLAESGETPEPASALAGRSTTLSAEEEVQPDDYTTRLLKAKRRAQQDHRPPGTA